MSKSESRQIRKDEFIMLHEKMKFYNMKKAYIRFKDDKLDVFAGPCGNSTAEITIEQVEEALNDLNK